MKYDRVIQGTFIDRPNRFIANVRIRGDGDVPDSDPIVRAHVKNTGRCREILIPGTEVFLQKGDNPSRSTPYDLIAARKGDLIINIDSQAPNAVAKESIEKILGPCDLVRPEYTLGESRFDFYAEQNGRRVLMEVKGVTKDQDHVVCFPDAPTERGLKHVRELTRLVKEGYRCVVCFIVQMEKADYFEPNYPIHEEFGTALEEADKTGVEVLAFACRTSPDALELADPVPVKFRF
ncbi:MAG: DNA/RNA nuclease SfsA [Candidatus Methanomethylophilaceae archaeon]|nr:DNA/RNA nuclease SfsA [Candidatus Methanomethylophilaceae archaeon]